MGCLGLQVFPSEKTQLCRLKLNLSHQLCDALLFELKKASGYVTMCLFFPPPSLCQKKTSASSYAAMCLFFPPPQRTEPCPMSTKEKPLAM
jgi:hypothetical protein